MSLISAAQQAANAANAQLSSGPKTEAGKRRSCFNALRHGLTGRVVVLPSEDLEQYQAFGDKFLAELKPKGELESQIAQTIIDTQWRLNRLRSIEDCLLSMGGTGGSACPSGRPELDAALSAAQAFRDNVQAFNNLSTYEQRLHRMLEKSIGQLRQLQAERKTDERFDLIPALRLYNTAKKQGKPFNPTDFGFDFSLEFLQKENLRHLATSVSSREALAANDEIISLRAL